MFVTIRSSVVKAASGRIKYLALAAVFVSTAFISLVGMPTAEAQDTWSFTGTGLQYQRARHTSTLLQNGKVLVRGLGSSNNINAEVYDPVADAWTFTSPVVDTRFEGLTSTLLPDGKVLSAGGYAPGASGTILSSSELYDPASGTWAATGSMNEARTFFGAVLLPTGKVLAMGGRSTSGAAVNTAELYDPTTGAWTYTGSLNSPRELFNVVLLADGKVMVLGGNRGEQAPLALNTAEIYDPNTGVWTQTGNMNIARGSSFAALLPNGKVLAAGDGQTAELYDPTTGLWSFTGSMITPRKAFSGATLPNGEVVVSGGSSEYIVSKKPVPPSLVQSEKYNVYSGQWTALAPMNLPRAEHATTVLPDGRALVSGGSNGADLTTSTTAELYDPIVNPKVFILLQGINSSLSKADIAANTTPGFDSVKTAILGTMPDAQFITYSYTGPAGNSNPTPRAYTCIPTLETPISVDIKLLDKQIQAVLGSRPNADIYLVAHSLGGAVAYGYLAALQERSDIVTPLPNANLKGVVTLDSPIGGINGASPYFSNAVTYFEQACPGFDRHLPTALLNLSTVFDSVGQSTPPDSPSDPQGSQASLLSLPFSRITIPQPYPSNQKVARDARQNGIATLAIGNTNDLLWLPSHCFSGAQDFASTQWLKDEGTNSDIYGRTFTSGGFNCVFDGIIGQANHLDVLSNPDVLQGIQQFLSDDTPAALSPAP